MGLRERALHLHAAGCPTRPAWKLGTNLVQLDDLKGLSRAGVRAGYGLLTGSQSFSRPQAPYVV